MRCWHGYDELYRISVFADAAENSTTSSLWRHWCLSKVVSEAHQLTTVCWSHGIGCHRRTGEHGICDAQPVEWHWHYAVKRILVCKVGMELIHHHPINTVGGLQSEAEPHGQLCWRWQTGSRGLEQPDHQLNLYRDVKNGCSVVWYDWYSDWNLCSSLLAIRWFSGCQRTMGLFRSSETTCRFGIGLCKNSLNIKISFFWQGVIGANLNSMWTNKAFVNKGPRMVPARLFRDWNQYSVESVYFVLAADWLKIIPCDSGRSWWEVWVWGWNDNCLNHRVRVIKISQDTFSGYSTLIVLVPAAGGYRWTATGVLER